jgi:predicted transcriptional regulator
MTMRLLPVFLTVLLIVPSLSAAQAITKDDLREMEQRLNSRIEDIKTQVGDLKSDIRSLSIKMDELDKRLSLVVLFVIALVALPQIFGFLRERRETKRFDDLTEEVEAIKKRLEMAKL